MKRHHDQENSYKKNIKLRLAYSLIGLVHYHRGKKHSSMQADRVLEKQLRVLHLDLRATEGDCDPRSSLSILDIKAYLHSDTLPPTRPHLLQQSHTPYGSSIQKHESMGVMYIQTTIETKEDSQL